MLPWPQSWARDSGTLAVVQQGVACVAVKGRTCLRSEAGGRSSCLASSGPWAGTGRVEALGGAVVGTAGRTELASQLLPRLFI